MGRAVEIVARLAAALAGAAIATTVTGCGSSSSTSCPAAPKFACNTKTPALGILQLDGYYWPTQPGDVNDLRTWCPVYGVDSPDYKCKSYGENEFGVPYFGVVMALVKEATWARVQAGEMVGNMREGFKAAVKQLYDDDNVCAIVGHAGFFAYFQSDVEKIIDELEKEQGCPIQRKPMILGAPSLAVAFNRPVGLKIPSFDLLKDYRDAVLIITSNFPKLHRLPSVKKVFSQFVDDLVVGTKNQKEQWVQANIANVFSLGFNQMAGYGISVVYGALFHNAYNTDLALPALLDKVIQNVTRLGRNIVGIVMESTEMSAMANRVRNHTGIPLWDISTIGKCLVKTGFSYSSKASQIIPALFETPTFRNCMMEWYTEPRRFEPLFGVQADGKLKYYEDQGLSKEQLKTLQCNGGRPRGNVTPIGRLMSEFDTGTKDLPVVPEVCRKTQLYCMCDGCPGVCPGGGSCGAVCLPFQTCNPPCGVQGENATTSDCLASTRMTSFNFTKSCPTPNPISNLRNIPLRRPEVESLLWWESTQVDANKPEVQHLFM